MSVIVEIRAAEGGDDAKMLVEQQYRVYALYMTRHGLLCEFLDLRPGMFVFEVSGPRAAELFAHEGGGHRWQRIPPNEKRGRVHTSTVTVAVLPVERSQSAELEEGSTEWVATRGSGAGGQARNKTSNAVVMKHIPTGLTVRVESERSQWQNRQTATRFLAAKVAGQQRDSKATALASDRRRQIGSGERGDKIRTVRIRDNRVTDHRRGKRTSATRYLAGHVEDLI